MLKRVLTGAAAGIVLIASSAWSTTFTTTSPTDGGQALPGGVTEIGGVVLDLIGLNGTRVVTQAAASSLFEGYFDTGTPTSYRGNPGTIGIQTGLTTSILGSLGGGLSELAVRITLDDGDTGIGDFDENANFLLINGIEIGDFTDVMAQETNSTGATEIDAPDPGFENQDLETGFFFENDATVLSGVYASLIASEQAEFQLRDDQDVYDNFFDFTAGIDGGLIDVGSGPIVEPGGPQVAEPGALAALGLGLLAFGVIRRRAA